MRQCNSVCVRACVCARFMYSWTTFFLEAVLINVIHSMSLMETFLIMTDKIRHCKVCNRVL